MNTINNPPHYQGASPIGRELLAECLGLTDEQLDLECIDFLEHNYQYCSFHLGNAIKYLWRCGIKGDAVEDLSKALWYLRRWQSPALKNFVLMFLSVFAGARIRPQINRQVAELTAAIEVALTKT